jgi:hypothetical protein
MKYWSFILLLLSVIILVNINSILVVHAQLSNNPICSSNTDSPCAKLNDLLAPCNSTFGPPPPNIQAYEYTVNGKFSFINF